ncbi:MAG TPA: FkbM family methyltransferase, partial [Thermoanaerobaculia bacterium]|nr:FkbM family methyltransferase [Thermoanaerobaculia bacterium]
MKRVRELRREGRLVQQLRRRARLFVRKRLWVLRTRVFGMKELDLGFGSKLHVHANDKLEYFIYIADFERSERDFVRRFFAGRGGTFVDAGANIGLFTVVAGEALRGKGTVHAFEPYGETFEHLQANVRLNQLDNVRLNRLALSAQKERLVLHAVSDGFNAYNSLAEPMIKGSADTSETVECTTLDEYCAANCPEGVDLVKIDVEGWEEKVIEGGTQVLGSDRAPVLLVEFCDPAAANAGTSCAALRKKIEGFGYTLYRYDNAT